MNGYPFPVYVTQGGGLVKRIGPDVYVFVEPPPHFDGLKEGDILPDGWIIVPANDAAREEKNKIEDKRLGF
jgi:hypothetical protein